MQKRVLSDDRLSTKQPFLHAQALYTGRPRYVKTIELQGVVGLEESCLILKNPPRRLNLRTGMVEELDKEGCLVPKGVILRTADATASYGDNVCQFTRDGFFYITPEATVHKRTVVREFEHQLALLDDRYAWLLCFSWEMRLIRVRLSDLRFDSFEFYDDAHYPKQPVLRPADGLWLLTMNTLQGKRSSLLQLGDEVKLTRIGNANAYWRGVPYTLYDGIHAGHFRIADSATDLFVNDTFLIACRESSVGVYAFDPDIPGEEVRVSKEERSWAPREVRVTHWPDENRPMVMLHSKRCLYVDLD